MFNLNRIPPDRTGGLHVDRNGERRDFERKSKAEYQTKPEKVNHKTRNAKTSNREPKIEEQTTRYSRKETAFGPNCKSLDRKRWVQIAVGTILWTRFVRNAPQLI